MARVPGGTSTNSKSLSRFPEGVGRLIVATGEICHSENYKREYIDCISGLGAVILGHCDEEVNNAAEEQIRAGHSFSLPTPLEEEVAELICDIVPSAEMVRFGKAGHEATMAAVRLARAYTKRDLVIVVKPSYHGCGDWYQMLHDSPGTPRHADDLYPDVRWLSYNSDIWPPADTAAIIMEPITVADPVMPHTGYLQSIKKWCDASGALLIFDEIVTFGRFPKLTAQEYFNVTPDLTCLGKCMGNGLPLSAICGRRDVMELLTDQVFFSTTFGGEAVSLAAAKACLTKLKREDVGQTLWDRGRRFMMDLRDVGLDVYGYPSRPVVRNEPEGFQAAMIERGVLVGSPVYFSLTLAMTDEVLDRIVEVCRDALFSII